MFEFDGSANNEIRTFFIAQHRTLSPTPAMTSLVHPSVAGRLNRDKICQGLSEQERFTRGVTFGTSADQLTERVPLIT